MLILFITSVLANAVMADIHTDVSEGNHDSHDAPHIHLQPDHAHDTHSEEDADDHEQHHIHLCFHMILLSHTDFSGKANRQEKPQHWHSSYLSLAHRPPVPPPTA